MTDPNNLIEEQKEINEHCPECKGKKIKQQSDDARGPDTSSWATFPCSACDGKGTYRAWAEGKIAYLQGRIIAKDQQIADLQIELRGQEEINRRDNDVKDKQIADLTEKGQKLCCDYAHLCQEKLDLAAENERLNKHEEKLESEIAAVCPEDFSLAEVFGQKQVLIEQLAGKVIEFNGTLEVLKAASLGSAENARRFQDIINDNNIALAEAEKMLKEGK